jgi:hypothetical protein
VTLPAFTKTSILVAAMLVVGVPKRGGSWLIVLVPIVIACSIYALVRMLARPAERRTRTMQLAAWISALAVICALQLHWSAAARKVADAVATALLAHRQLTGSFPSNLGQIGIDASELLAEWRLVYRVRDGAPDLTYPAQVMPISTHEYDFERRAWRLNAY